VTELTAIVDELWELHKRFIARSGSVAGSKDDVRFLALAVGGEVGEVLGYVVPLILALAAETGSVQNQVKKSWRGFGDEDLARLSEEIGDAFVYLVLLARSLKIDVENLPRRALSKARRKIVELENR
jgi:NTP pyrophosphatase (non-canonical NTP hydrolase)